MFVRDFLIHELTINNGSRNHSGHQSLHKPMDSTKQPVTHCISSISITKSLRSRNCRFRRARIAREVIGNRTIRPREKQPVILKVSIHFAVIRTARILPRAVLNSIRPSNHNPYSRRNSRTSRSTAISFRVFPLMDSIQSRMLVRHGSDSRNRQRLLGIIDHCFNRVRLRVIRLIFTHLLSRALKK